MLTLENSSNQPQNMDNQTEQFQTPLNNYSNALKQRNQDIFPKKEQGILLNVVEELKLSDYVMEIGKLVGPKNILFASRISNNRICIYLSSIKLVDKIVEEHSMIAINDYEIGIRRLVTPARRIVISNVCPSIPHHIIESELKQLGIKTVSPVSCIRAGITGDEYSHVMSFRRQVYSMPSESEELPSSILITHDNTKYRIYLSDDNLKCYICKAPGHIARRCPTQSTGQIQTIVSSITADKSVQILNQIIEPDTNNPPEERGAQLSDKPTTKDVPVPAVTSKRPAETISTPSEFSTDEFLSEIDNLDEAQISQIILGDPQKNPKRSSKKMKKSDSKENLPNLNKSISTESLTSVRDSLQPIENLLKENEISTDLTFEQITDFIENAYGCKDPLSLARQYSENIPGVVQLLEDIQPYHTSRNMKNRCTRLRKKMVKLMNGAQASNSESDSETF